MERRQYEPVCLYIGSIERHTSASVHPVGIQMTCQAASAYIVRSICWYPRLLIHKTAFFVVTLFRQSFLLRFMFILCRCSLPPHTYSSYFSLSCRFKYIRLVFTHSLTAGERHYYIDGYWIGSCGERDREQCVCVCDTTSVTIC